MPREQRYTVFEAINERLREIFVGVTSEQMFQAIAEMEHELPVPIRHWNLKDVLTVRSIEFNLTEGDARAFIERYLKSAPTGWHYITGPVTTRQSF